MSFTQLTEDLNILSSLPDQPNDSAQHDGAWLKAKFDEAAGKIKLYLNGTLLVELAATGAAANIGVAPIAGVTADPNLQAVLEEIYSQISSGLADNSILPRHLNTAFRLPQGYIATGAVQYADLDTDSVYGPKIKDGGVYDGKLAANSVNETNIKSGAVSVMLTATIPAEVEGESAWSAQGSPFGQEVNVSGLSSSLTTTYTAHNSGQASIVDSMTFETGNDQFSVKIDTAPTDDVIVDIAQSGGSSYSEVTIPASAWAAKTAPYKQDVAVTGLLATDTPIVDIVPDATFATAEAQLEAYGVIYRMVAGDGTLTVYATEPTETDISIQLKVVRK